MGSLSSIIIRKPSHDKVWENYFKNGDFHKCPLCRLNYIDKSIHTIEKNYGCWRRTRKVSKTNGGSNHINNFLPICWQCNQSAGNQDLKDFAKMMEYNYP